MDSLYRLPIFLAFFAGCAQPSAVSTDGGRIGHPRDGGQLQFEEDGGFAPPDDLSGRDLAQVQGPDLAVRPDLAIPPGADLAGVDFASPPDLAHVTTTVENCFNDIDDDGNGKVNDGCPDTISVGADVLLTAYGGSGGGPGSAHCPAGQVVTGMRFDADDFDEEMAGVGLACSTVTLVRGASSYTVSVSANTTIGPAFDGSDWDSYRTGFCDTTQFQVAWNTRMNTSESGNYPYVHGLGLDCGLGTLTLSSTNQLTISFSNLGNGFGINYGWGSEHPQACGPSQAVVGYKGRFGGWLDQIQPICAPLVVSYK
jgi:hypothetical protein